MATFLPDQAMDYSLAHVKMFRALKRALANQTLWVWQRLPNHPDVGPCFTLVDQHNRALFIRVAALTRVELQVQPQCLQQLATELEAKQQNLFSHFLKHPVFSGIPCYWLFPNLSQAELAPLKAFLPLGKEQSRDLHWLLEKMGEPLMLDELEQMRTVLIKDTVVHHYLTVRKKRFSQAARFKEMLLSYDQELAMKMELLPPAPGNALIKNFGVRLITGIPGSGKSLVLLHRVHLLRECWPDRSILVLMHNKPALREMHQRYKRLSHQDAGVKWFNFSQWCWHKVSHKTLKPISDKEREHFLAPIWKHHFPKNEISLQRVLGEFDFYKDRLLFSLGEYLQATRDGQGFSLTKTMRRRIYACMKAYDEQLRQQNMMDWSDLPRLVWHSLETGKLRLQAYDVIFIDEAQFFAPIWFELVKKALRPGGQLFLAADPAQGFLRRGRSWLAAGMDIRGKSFHLSTCYRSTRAILTAASHFVEQRLGPEEGCLDPARMATTDGLPPQLVTHENSYDEVTWLLNELEYMVYDIPKDILILPLSYQLKNEVIKRFVKRFDASRIGDLSSGTSAEPGQIRICQLNSATGLESPIVFVIGLALFFEKEGNPILSPEERQALIKEHTRKLYVAMTRASQRLILSCSGPVPAALEQALKAAVHLPARDSLF